MKSPAVYVVTFALLLSGIIGYVIGKEGFVINNPLASPESSATPSPNSSPAGTETIACTLDAKLCPDGSSVGRIPPNCEFAACPLSANKKVTGGGILDFPRYELTIPPEWEITRESQTSSDEKVTLSAGFYKLTIQQGGFGGAMCLYPGDPDSVGPAGRYKSYTEIVTGSGDQLRRSVPETTDNTIVQPGYGICQHTQYGWGTPTIYGHISFVTPPDADQQMIGVMDNILKSLTNLSR